MKYREVGRTGLRISEIGFGCGGNAGLMIKASPEEQRQTIARAIELGINYFDNSPDYGDGVAETNLGRVLKELGVRPFITSKVEIRAHDLGDIAGHVERSTEESLQRLGVDYLDFLQIHNGPIEPAPALEGRAYARLWIQDYLRPGGALEGLERVVRKGKARFIGFITRGKDIGPARQLLDTGAFHLVNASHHLLNPTPGYPKPPELHADDWGQVIDQAEAHGVGVAIYSPLASGALTGDAVEGRPAPSISRGPRPDTPEGARMVERARALGFLHRPGTHSLAQAAYRFILSHSGVTSVLGGFSSINQLEELAPTSGAGPLSEEDMVRVQMAWRGNFGLAPN